MQLLFWGAPPDMVPPPRTSRRREICCWHEPDKLIGYCVTTLGSTDLLAEFAAITAKSRCVLLFRQAWF